MEVRSDIPRDAIPSVDKPAFGPDYFGGPDDEVIVVDEPGSPARAYPIRILHYHEIVNDEIDGRPIAVTWCPLCASAVVDDARLDGRVVEFGVSGKLADDDLVMYDRQTGSEWKQSEGRAIAGEFEGRELGVVPAPMLPYRRFVEAFPGGVVLQPPGGESEVASDDETPAGIDRGALGRYWYHARGHGYIIDVAPVERRAGRWVFADHATAPTARGRYVRAYLGDTLFTARAVAEASPEALHAGAVPDAWKVAVLWACGLPYLSVSPALRDSPARLTGRGGRPVRTVLAAVVRLLAVSVAAACWPRRSPRPAFRGRAGAVERGKPPPVLPEYPRGQDNHHGQHQERQAGIDE